MGVLFTRVEEKSPRLTKDQWRMLELLEAGWVAQAGTGGYYSLVTEDVERLNRYAGTTIISLLRRDYIELRVKPAVKITGYYLSAEGQRALRLRRENRSGSGLL